MVLLARVLPRTRRHESVVRETAVEAKIEKIADGYEPSFIAFPENPVKEFRRVGRILEGDLTSRFPQRPRDIVQTSLR